MPQRQKPAAIRYGAAILAIVIGSLFRTLFGPGLEGGGFAVFFVVVVIVAWYGGLGPSLLAVSLSVLASGLIFGPAPGQDPAPPVRVLLGFGAFLFVTVVTALLSESMRAAQRRAEAQADEAVLQREQLRRSELALREADRRKDEFLAILAHELRNPLAPICSSLDILRSPAADADDSRHATNIIERQVHHLVRLVDDLLDVSRIMRGKIELRPEAVDLQSIVARAVESAQPILRSQRHELTVSLPREPVAFTADPIRLGQVVNNLLTNAAKYTEPGGQIWLIGDCSGDQITIRVRDTGIGISPEMLPRVFQLFTQIDSSLGRSQGGLGIGLTLVKSLVELNGGQVEAYSDGLGKGSEFVVRLPSTLAQQPKDSRRAGSTRDTSAGKHRILVVDDNADAAQTLKMLLQMEGHDVCVAHDGAVALETAKLHTPDIIFLDIGMPRMDGLEVARRMRQLSETEHSMLVAVTGWGSQEDRQRTQAAGFDFHMVKPVTHEAINELLLCRSNMGLAYSKN